MKPTVLVYESTDGWRWRLVSPNGRVLASGESFSSKRSALRAVATVRREFARCKVKVTQ